ncbi:RelA/SpoT family protein [Haliovirga abyssi]|uniref:Guanosine-3',5'-bis(Diphosphate) 3'-pyrophosphohydrolase n=1 Tax=Haliovirga abyssi TaxID=2996794 RepID=A0AAU9DSY5_9FUSO|nr:bifunctional (p)ppGpp synthetase/guanosine-3',5'-bis(diphosphate) 3'-pyrophosphohydrolase [Haliovirga abyssi]BDU50199.1 guanosine-3',5'-bis(diphosphate) 3'-pyrophosphohydrolase [Haliovirga abyssi]
MGYASKLFFKIKEEDLPVDVDKIKLAYEFAKEAHTDQYRKSGEEYIIHPIAVAMTLVEMKMDTDTIVAGLLHDVVEDTLIPLEEIKLNFGETVAYLVEGVTKLRNLPAGTKKQTENIRKMIVAMAKDVRVVIIKLADRLHNMSTLKHMTPEKQQRIADETLKIYAPIAHRLGMAKVKWELEDLCLYYLKPEEYRKIISLISSKRKEREEYTEEVKKKLLEEMKKSNIAGEVTGRPKHFYSIYKKMTEKGKSFADIYDLIAIRVVVDTEGECYNVLGILHNIWKPVPGRFKDYIAVPKSNGYQSIHTTIVGPSGKFVEIQIRTLEMHKIAEDGIAAHWKYKEKIKKDKSEHIYSWLKKILEWQDDASSSEEFVQTVTGDILSEEVFIFSPKGDVVELPNGSTPLDFAFRIHTQIGYKCIGAKVNGCIVSLDYKLQSGDKVDIITSKTAKGPGKDWMNLVVTHGAKAKIKKWFKEKEFDERVKEGRFLLEKELINFNIKSKDIEDLEEVKEYIKKHNIPSYNEFLFKIGIGKIDVTRISEKFKSIKEMEEEEKILTQIDEKPKRRRKNQNQGIVIKGVENTVIRFAKCCTPLPGDEIGGFITKGNGIAIHRKDCKNFKELKEKSSDRVIKVSWEEDNTKSYYSVSFVIIVADRSNLLSEIIRIIGEHRINITGVNSMSFKENGEKRANIKMTIEIREKEQFERLTQALNRTKDVIEIRRS